MQLKKLGEIFKLKQGNHLPLTELTEGKYSVFGANGKIGLYDKYMYEEPMVLVSCRGVNCGAINLTENNSWVTGNSIALVDLGVEKIYTKYIYYVLKQTNFSNVISGSAQPQIIVSNLINLQISLPSISDQKTIVEKLDNISNLIQLKKESINKTEELTKSVFFQYFGDISKNTKNFPIAIFSDICSIECKLVDPKLDKFSDYICIGGANIVSETGELINLCTAKEEGSISNKFLVTPKDILFSKIRPKLKKVSYPNMNCLCSADIYPIRPKEDKIEHLFLIQFLLSDLFTAIVTEIAEKRAQIPKVNREELLNLAIPLPPINLQKVFAKIVYENLKILQNQKFALNKLEALYNTTIQEVFNF